MTTSFESALQGRVDAMLDACTRCGKCVEVCPATEPAGLSAEQRQNPSEVIGGVIGLLRGQRCGAQMGERLSPFGRVHQSVRLRRQSAFLLGMARVAMAKAENEAATQRRAGVEGFRTVARDVNVLARLQLDNELLARLGQIPKRNAAGELPDFVFYTGCNVLKTPHIALLALDVMDALGISYEVMGGPTHCCGVQQLRAGDLATFGRVAENTLDKLARSKTGEVLSWCPSCHVQFTEITLPAVEKTRGAKPFDMTPFTLFLRRHLDRMRPLLRERVPMRIALHRHPGVHGVVEAAEEILSAVPGIEVVDLHQPAVGLQANNLRVLPQYRRELQEQKLLAAESAGVDALVAVYHSDHRELCAHERDWPFRIMNFLEIVGASMGLHHDDHIKRLKMLQDADAILADCRARPRRRGNAPRDQGDAR